MSDQCFDHKRVACPVHGTIGLSELETRFINTSAFRRLRNIRQLGLAYYVYPGADYSRLSHSLGACHVTGQILDAISRACPQSAIERREYRIYRLAALLHDIGHYPFSHAMEHAIENHFSKQFTEAKRLLDAAKPVAGNERNADALPKFYKHEEVGEQILKHDPEVREILKGDGIRPEEVYSIFNRQSPPRFANLVSSDLDADRIDYLLRTAHHTGLPYGSVDLGYILSQVRLDRDSRICITPKAIRTADHFLLCRHFDYQQIAYHKTVAALEYVLKDVLQELVRTRKVLASAADIKRLIEAGEWRDFDDIRVFELIRALSRSAEDPVARQKASAVIDRTPPKLVANIEFFGDEAAVKRYHSHRQLVKQCVKELAQTYGIDQSLWYVWSSDTRLTKMGPHIPLSAAKGLSGKEQDRLEQAIRVVDTNNGTSKPIMSVENSLMSILADRSLFIVRVYVLLSAEQATARESISKDLRDRVSGVD